MTIFLDANILFSASFRTSNLRAFVDVLETVASLVTSQHAAEEARRNVARKKADNTPALESLLVNLEVSPVAPFALDVEIAEKDIPILCGAILLNADYLLTGDKKDFGAFYGRKIKGVKIVSPAILAAELTAKGYIDSK